MQNIVDAGGSKMCPHKMMELPEWPLLCDHGIKAWRRFQEAIGNDDPVIGIHLHV